MRIRFLSGTAATLVAAGVLAAHATVALAIDMTGNPAGEKMRDRLGGGPGDRPWLVFGLVPVE